MHAEPAVKHPYDAGDEVFWQAVTQRDDRYDAKFVFAVRSTGVYCRPSCPARRPDRRYVQFYPDGEIAEQHGFRPCKRCHPNSVPSTEADLAMIKQACTFIAENTDASLTLATLGRQVGLSPAHFQRRFKAVMGSTPAHYVKARRTERLKVALRDGQEVTDALYAAGYQSSNGLYRDAAATLGMTPSAYRRHGAGLAIRYSVAPCALGFLLLAATDRGVCNVRLGDDAATLAAELTAEYAAAQCERDDAGLRPWIEAVVQQIDGRRATMDLPLDVAATAFQMQVWQALRAIPYGSTRSYQAIANQIERPGAVRAVGQACGANPVAIVVPCHRVVRSDGELGGYRWGIERKRALLAKEREGDADRAFSQ